MEHIGHLLRAHREELGAPDAGFAKLLRISVARLREIEASDDLGVGDFERYCGGLAVDPGALLGHADKIGATRTVARFRAAVADAGDVSWRDVRLLSSAAEVGTVLGRLLALLDRRPQLWASRSHRAVTAYPEPWQQGYELGEAALMRLGVHVARVDFDAQGVEGASLWEPAAMPVILLNRRAPRNGYTPARRAILAHELCHLLHDGGEDEVAARVTSAEGQGNYHEAVEQRARAFAPAFLAPRSQVRAWAAAACPGADPEPLVVQLASYWGLSYEGACWHAKNCELIPAALADELANKRTKHAISHEEFEASAAGGGLPLQMLNPELPEEPHPLMVGVAASLVLDALEASSISLGRARELLAWR